MWFAIDQADSRARRRLCVGVARPINHHEQVAQERGRLTADRLMEIFRKSFRISVNRTGKRFAAGSTYVAYWHFSDMPNAPDKAR
jgi:hypothetical protein